MADYQDIEGFTPGPWEVIIDDDGNPLSGRPSVSASDELDCGIVHWDGFVQEYWRSARGDKEIHANARLIAAAPEMHADNARLRAENERLREADINDFQSRVGKWIQDCFPPRVCADRLERRDRFVEEALELAQTLPAFTAERAHALVDYVFSRPVGATEQEVGGVAVTLAALCEAEGIQHHYWAEMELARISTPETMKKIRAKQAAKPVGSALPSLALDGAE